jgi:cytochrome c-type biogenesis protein CcmH
MRQAPDDAEGWTMLGRTYFATGQTEKAEQALARAYELLPKDATVVLAYAESIAANQGNDLSGRPADLIGEALAADPENATARWLSGMAAYQRGQFTAAAVAWKKALGQLAPDSEDAGELRQLIEQAERRAGVPPEQRQLAQASGTAADGADDKAAAGDAVAAAPEPPDTARATQPPAAAAADSGAAISVEVSLDPTLAERAAPDTTVFVYAKAAAGPPMPLAVQRVTVADLPVSLTLDDSMAMMPAMKLSGFPQVIVGARVSASGQAMPRPGDLEGETGPISSSSAEPVQVRIDSVRP